MKVLLGKLRDGHVSLTYPLPGDTSSNARLPFIVSPVEGKYVVYRIGAALAGQMTRGDVLLSIDGKTVTELEQLITPIEQVATPESTRHYVGLRMTRRPFWIPTELQPQGANARAVFQRADGTEYSLDIPWTVTNGGLDPLIVPPAPPPPPPPAPPSAGPGASAAIKKTGALPDNAAFSATASWLINNAGVAEVEQSRPYFFTPEVSSKLTIVEVTPKKETLTALGVTVPDSDATAPDSSRYVWMRAYKYAHKGKTILLVRIPSYVPPKNNPDENVAWLGALLRDNLAPATPGASLENTPADVVVVDDTHNPGGNVAYVQGLAALFATKPIPNQVQAKRTDRKWVNNLLTYSNNLARAGFATEQNIILGRLRSLETALDSGKWLAPFESISGTFQGPTAPDDINAWPGGNMLPPNPLVQWNKPVLVLHDELSGSGGDAFPSLLQFGGVAKTFGARTMGLGGTVELVATLPNSQGELRLTRGLFAPYQADGTYDTADFIENNGVTPNFPYDHTLADFRAGFVGYVTAFSDIVVTLNRD